MWTSILLLLIACFSATLVLSNDDKKRTIFIRNSSGGRLELLWLNPDTKERTSLYTIADGADFPIDTYVGQKFEVHEVPSDETGKCNSSPCRIGSFAASETEDLVVLVNADIEVELTDRQQVGDNKRTVSIRNNSGSRLELLWVNPNMKERTSLSTIADGADFPTDTYVGQKFELREVPSDETGKCNSSPCRIGSFAASEIEDLVVLVNADIEVELTNKKQRVHIKKDIELTDRQQEGDNKRTISIRNNSGGRLELLWLNPDTKERTSLYTIADGADFPIDTYVGQKFELREVPSDETGKCNSSPCRIGSFAASETEDLVVLVNADIEVELTDKKQGVDIIKDIELTDRQQEGDKKRTISIQNNSGGRLELLWLNPDTKERTSLSTIAADGADFPIDTYVGQKFELREVPSDETGKCNSSPCRIGSFAASEIEDLVVLVNADIEVELTNKKQRVHINKDIELTDRQQEGDKKRTISIRNNSGGRLELLWLNPDTKERTPLYTIVDGAHFPIDTYVGQEFELREVPSDETGTCNSSPDNTCRIGNFAASEKENLVVLVNAGVEVELSDTMKEERRNQEDVFRNCESLSRKMVDEAGSSKDALIQAMEKWVNCVEKSLANRFEKANEEINFQQQRRKMLAARMENYTCEDKSLDDTPDVRTDLWKYADGIDRTVHIKHDRAASQIHVVENFIDEEECKAMEEEANGRLHRGMVADGKGGNKFTPNRKALQARIKVNWAAEAEGDPIARLDRRIFDYTNHVLGLNIQEVGQEDLMSIQYFGRGKNDTEPDRYMPHCDGDCTGLPHKNGERVATMVMYCKLPTEGGLTNFGSSNVHVKPVSGNAVFFSYIDPETLTTDTGFTIHSGCPVFEGEKKIVTQWIRLGVDEDNSFDSFNTLGIKKSDAVD